MKKKILLMMAAILPMVDALGYSVDTKHPPFYFEEITNNNGQVTGEVMNRNTTGDGWLQGNTIYNVTNHALTSTSEPNFYRIIIEKPGVAVKCWGISTSQDIGNAVWMDDSASTNCLCAYDDEYKDAGTVYLYVWLKWMRYNVRFVLNGGEPVEPIEDGNCYTNTIALPTPTRTGYNFLGWTNSTLTAALTGDNTGAELQVQEDGETIVLYAKWEPKTFKVTFNPNGEGATVGQSEKTVTYDSPYGELATPVWADHAFVGWFTGATEGMQVQSNTVVSITADQTLYARWSQLYTVSFEYSSGGIIKQYTDVPSGSYVEPPGISEVTAPEGKRFTGDWLSDEYKNVTRDLIILPKFYDIETTLIVTYDPMAGGSCEINNNGYGLYEYGRTVTLTVTPNEAYDFAGWSDGSMDNPYNVRVITSTNLVAQFTLKKYTVTFLDWDGTTTNDTRVVEHGSAADAPPPIEHPGYAFTGWSADINSVTSNTTVVAQYAANQYVVVYDANGGEGAMTNEVFTYGMEYQLQSNAYTRAVNQFFGWASSPDATTNDVEYVDGATVSNLTTVANGTNILYAVWSSQLSDLSVAADCTNLVLTCSNANQLWVVDATSGYGSDSSVKTVGNRISYMTASVIGSGTITFRTKLEAFYEDETIYENPILTFPKNAEGESTRLSLAQTGGEWKEIVFEVSGSGATVLEWTFTNLKGQGSGENPVGECNGWVDQVHWYPNRFVAVDSNKLTDEEKNVIKEAILQRWDAILGENASIVTHATATGSFITNAVELLEDGSVPKITVDPEDSTKATLEFSENMSRSVPVPSIADCEYTGALQTAAVPDDDRYEVSLNEGGTTVGVYQVVISLVDTNSYCWAGGRLDPLTLTFAITKATNAWVRVPYILGWTNGEDPNEPNMGEARFGEVNVMYGVQGSTMSPSPPETPGEYVAEFTVEGTGNYDGLTTNVEFAITKSGKETKLEEVFDGLPVTVAPDGNGGWKVTITNDIDSARLPIEIPDNLGPVTLDLNGHSVSSAEADQPAISIVADAGAGEPTVLTVVTTGGDAAVRGGDGAPAIKVEDGAKDDVRINIGAGVSVQGGGVPAIDGKIGTNEGDIEKVPVEPPAIAAAEYTGALQTADVPDSALYDVAQNEGGMDAGSYPVVLELADTNNYCWAGGDSNPTSLTFTITKAANEWTTEPSLSTNRWTYVDTPGVPDMGAAKFGEVGVAYRLKDGGALETELPDEPGEYVAVFSVPETANWTGLAEEIQFTIASLVDENLKVGKYYKIMIADLGYELVPTNGAQYSVVAKGLPSGLKLKYNAAVKNKKGKVVTKAKTTWWIEGVPTAALEYMTNPPYLVITAGGKTETYPLSMEVFAQKVTDLGDFQLGTAINEQHFLPGVVKGWTVSGLPTGLKYTAKKVTKKSGKKTVTVAEAYSVYGKMTKAGLFTVTAKKKVGGFYETLKFRMFVAPNPVVDTERFSESLTNLTTMAYEPVAWYLTNDVSAVGGKVTKVSGLPAGLSFAANNVYGYKDAKKKTGKYIKREGQTILGTPTKPGTNVVTFTKSVKSGKKTVAKTEQILWVVTPNSAEVSLGFNTSGGEIKDGLVGLRYGDLMAFDATDGAKVTASGLPAGITLADLGGGNYAFKGYTTKAGTYLVTVTATLKGKTVRQRIALKVDGLPAWAKGAFNGYIAGVDGATNGLATVSVSSVGKISGKFYEGGTNWALSAACYTERAPVAPYQDAFTCSNVVAQYAYKVTTKVNGKKKTVTRYVKRAFTLTVAQDELGGVAALEEEGGSTVQAWQNLWGTAAYKAIGKALFSSKSGKKTLAYKVFTIKGTSDGGKEIGLADEMTLSLKVTTAGAVTATMTYDTGKTTKDKKTKKTVKVYYKPTCSTAVIPTSVADADPFSGVVFLYFAPSTANNFPGYIACVPTASFLK